MWRIIIFLITLLNINLLAKTTHLQELNNAYPYGLLTDDFGILNINDLKINSCMATPSPFTEDSISYSYWQCFEIKTAKLDCEGRIYDPESKERVSLIVVSGIRNGELHEFISRRVIPLWFCRIYKKNWLKFTKKQKHVCMTGSLIHKKILKNKIKWAWTFDRYKTKKGCDSYFEDECYLKNYQARHKECY